MVCCSAFGCSNRTDRKKSMDKCNITFHHLLRHIEMNSILTIPECDKILQRYRGSNDFTLTNYTIKSFSDTVNGFLSEYLLINISFQTKGVEKQKRFFAKRFPYQHELQSSYLISVKAYENEICTYDVLFKEFNNLKGFTTDFAPKYYYSRKDLIILEDLSELNYIIHPNPNELPLDHIKLSLKLLATFHSGSIGYQELKTGQLGRKYCLSEDYAICTQEPLFRKEDGFLGYSWFKGRLSAVNALIDLIPFPDITPKELKEKLLILTEEVFEIMKPTTKHYNVLCHGDMWGKNVMFQYENNVLSDAKLIDFQLQRYCPPAHDVLQFIFLTMNSERRKHYYNELLLYYYNCLQDELKKSDFDLDDIIGYSDYEASINYLLPQIKLQTMYYYTFQGPNQEFHKKVTSNVDDLKKFVFGDGAPFAIDLYNTDSNFRRLVTEALIELKNLLVLREKN
ncbi:hypothetical protein FQA39_LY05514 [Lamprigera yunnana]|nr:hypothetical protein FQA39_LY05514 [Lamprigera yunnana]